MLVLRDAILMLFRSREESLARREAKRSRSGLPSFRFLKSQWVPSAFPISILAPRLTVFTFTWTDPALPPPRSLKGNLPRHPAAPAVPGRIPATTRRTPPPGPPPPRRNGG